MCVCVCVCVCVCQNVHIDPPPNKDHLHNRIYPSPGKAKEPIVTANWFLSRRRHHLDNNVCRVNLLHQSQYPKWEVVDLIASSDEHTNYNKHIHCWPCGVSWEPYWMAGSIPIPGRHGNCRNQWCLSFFRFLFDLACKRATHRGAKEENADTHIQWKWKYGALFA